MGKICSRALLTAAITVLSGLGAGAVMAYRPENSRYYNDYYGEGPGVNHDYGTGYSGVYDYDGPSDAQDNAQVTSDNTVRSYPGFNTNTSDTSTYEFDPNYWWD